MLGSNLKPILKFKHFKVNHCCERPLWKLEVLFYDSQSLNVLKLNPNNNNVPIDEVTKVVE